jgi:hypothetical protein
METVPYRRTKLSVKTFPAGTLLFRLVQRPIDDTRGVLLKDGKRCITPNYNVYFYPNPFAGKLALEEWLSKYKNVTVYVLTKDVKVLWLLKPSKYTRTTKNTQRNFIKKCSLVPRGCLPRSGDSYNPCLSNTIIEKYPDIVGMVSLSPNDARRIRAKLPRSTRKIQSYFHSATDELKIESVPELILHPLAKRPSKDVIVSEGDKLENNYKQIKSISTDNVSKLVDFMDKHAVYNSETFFYTYKE